MSAGHFAKSLKGNLMRIAVISTAYKLTPTGGYGGIERVVYTLVVLLCEEEEIKKDMYCRHCRWI